MKSQIIKASGEPVNVDYMMRRNGDRWLISDIYLDGAISEVATRRSEFAAILRTDGVDGLITNYPARLRAVMAGPALEQELERLLGTPWDNELEPFRRAGDGAPVRWLHAAV